MKSQYEEVSEDSLSRYNGEPSHSEAGASSPREGEQAFSIVDEIAHVPSDADIEIIDAAVEILEPEPVEDGYGFGAKPKVKRSKASGESKAVPFGEDWTLTERWLKVSRKFGLSDEAAEDEFQNCRLHYLGTGKQATAWVFLWEAWCKRAAGSPRRAATSRHARKPTTDDIADLINNSIIANQGGNNVQ